jgi:hypothetical protein
MLLRRGVPITYVSRQLGHSSISVTADLYGHFIPGKDRHHVSASESEQRILRPVAANPHTIPYSS